MCKRTEAAESEGTALRQAEVLPEMAFDPIEAALRQLHERMISEDIPEEFIRLLEQLENGADGRKHQE